MFNRKRWMGVAAGLVVLGAAVGALAWRPVRAHMQAAAVLMQLNGQEVPRLLAAVAAKPIHVEDVTFQVPGRTIQARIYAPVGEPDAPGLVLVPGVYYLGIEEPRLRGYARWMAQCGLRVLTPDVPGTREYHIDHDSVETIGQSAQWFAHKTGGPVGLMAISFSGGLSLLAAAQPEYASSVKMVFTTGAPDDITRLVAYYATGAAHRPDGSLQRLKPNVFGPLVVEYAHLERIYREKDLPVMTSILRAHLTQDAKAERALRDLLTDEQKHRLTGLLDPEDVAASIALATPGLKEQMDEISPHGHLAGLTAPTYLLHGEGDTVIPSAEGEWLALDVPPGKLDGFLISPVVSHIDLGGKARGLRDKWDLLHFMGRVMMAAHSR